MFELRHAMAGDALRLYTSLYPDLQEFYAGGVVENGSSIDVPLFFRPHGLSGKTRGHRDQGQGRLRKGQGLEPTAPPPSEYSFELYPNIESLHLDLDRLSLAPDEPELDYTFDIEPDYDVDDNVDNNGHKHDSDHRNVEKTQTKGRTNNLNLINLNLNDAESKLLRDKNIEVPPMQPPASATKDFHAWMTWRLQANKLLAALVLIRSGRRVHLRHSEVYRKPLTVENVHSIVRDAKGGAGGDTRCGQTTSLTGCPYIMYGIPRVKLSRPATPAVTTKPYL